MSKRKRPTSFRTAGNGGSKRPPFGSKSSLPKSLSGTR